MAHEIYYTSAPEGLRPGDRGFCTVAATEGIPRVLWDRLEALSGYRHSADGQNPITLAHWVLALSGQNYHVLSRVCDAGLDYTQRTNSFAHHVVLEPGELAAGGPAYMLSQPGVLAGQWNGQVGPIVRRTPLPRGDVQPRVCSTWQSVTGDAGWAGIVAQSIATSPWKPIGLVYAPGQDVMPLIAEVTALLPAASRWQVTFNTYFTSLPGGMTCQWRCCVAGSPTAAATLRSAAGGVALDLTRGTALGSPPDGSWTEAARSGRTVAAATKSAPPAPPPRFVAPVAKPPQPARNVEPMPVVQDRASRTEKAVVIHRRGLLGTQEATADEPAAPIAEFSWMAERRNARQKQLLVVYAIACVTLIAGLWLGFWAYHTSAERPLPPPPPASQPVVILPPPATEPIAIAVPAVTHEIAPVVETPKVVAPVVVPTPPVVVVPPPPPLPATFAVDSLPPPEAGNGVRNSVSSVPVPLKNLDHPESITQMFLAFPDGAKQWQFKQADLDGVFSQAPGTTPHPHVQIKWRDTSGLTPASLVATVRYDNERRQLDVTWSNSMLLSKPDVTKLCYWMLQNATLTVADSTAQRTQRITFSPVAIKPMRLTDPNFAASLPENLPFPPDLHIAKSEPEGWLPGTAVEPEKKDGDVLLLRIEKPPGRSGIVPAFTLRYSPSHQTLSSDLAKVIESARADLDAAAADSAKAKTEIQQTRDAFAPGTAAIEQGIKDWQDKKDKSAAAPQPGDLTQEQFQGQIDKMKKDLQTQAVQLDAATAQAVGRQKDADERAAAINEALSAYGDLKELDINLDLPQGLRVGTVRLTKEGN